MTQPIKPCPHCGAQPSFGQCGETSHWIECWECDGNTYLSHEDAKEAWNTRSSEAFIRAEISKLEVDERLHQPRANVFVNAPLAMVQVTIEGTLNGLYTALGELCPSDRYFGGNQS